MSRMRGKAYLHAHYCCVHNSFSVLSHAMIFDESPSTRLSLPLSLSGCRPLASCRKPALAIEGTEALTPLLTCWPITWR